MTTDNHQKDFEKIVKDAGIPTTEAEMRQQWNQINEDQGSLIKNDSKWSSFWKLLTAIVTTPAMWVVQFLINQLLPNSFIKTAKGVFLEILAWALGLTRKPATYTHGKITFTRDQIEDAVLVPAGTIIKTPPINGNVYEVATLEDTLFPDNELTLDIEVKATNEGAAHNLAPGYYSIISEPVEGVISARNHDDWITTPGADAEEDEDLRLRCRNRFTAVGQFHHDAAYRAIIAEFSGLQIDYIWFEHGAPRGPGSANSYLMIDSGAPDQPFVDQVNQHIVDNGYHGHGDDMQCFPMPETFYSLTADAYINPNLTEAEQDALMLDIENMIRSAFRENQDYEVTRTKPFNRFSFSQLGKELHNTLNGLESIEFDRLDITSSMELPMLDTLTINKRFDMPEAA